MGSRETAMYCLVSVESGVESGSNGSGPLRLTPGRLSTTQTNTSISQQPPGIFQPKSNPRLTSPSSIERTVFRPIPCSHSLDRFYPQYLVNGARYRDTQGFVRSALES